MATQKIAAAPSVRRLPLYLQTVRQAQREGIQYISGTFIAHELNLKLIQVRKDLSITPIIGKPKKGYPIGSLMRAIEHFFSVETLESKILTWGVKPPFLRFLLTLPKRLRKSLSEAERQIGEDIPSSLVPEA
jgi:NADH/NAD ratio-sensing transcriptional regulator Rex